MNPILVKIADVFFCILIRIILLIQIGFATIFLSDFYNQKIYYGLLLGAFAIIIDCIYILFVKHSKELRWYIFEIKS